MSSVRSSDRLSATDIRQIAAMHCECLPDSLVSRIGPRYARAFYRHVDRSTDELAFVHRSGGRVASACIVSLEPHTLKRRLLTRTALVLHAPLALRRLPLRGIASSLIGRGGGEEEGGAMQPRGPEVLLIFTEPAARSSGLGAQTLARCEEHLRERGHQRYYVKTADESDNRAIGFYLRNGFARIGTVVDGDKRLALFEKDL